VAKTIIEKELKGSFLIFISHLDLVERSDCDKTARSLRKVPTLQNASLGAGEMGVVKSCIAYSILTE